MVNVRVIVNCAFSSDRGRSNWSKGNAIGDFKVAFRNINKDRGFWASAADADIISGGS